MNTKHELPYIPDGIRDSEYRLIYLRPHEWSDELLVIGVVVKNAEAQHFVLVNNPSAVQALLYLFGESGVEQYQLGLNLMRQTLQSELTDLSAVVSPSSIFEFGPIVAAECDNVTSFARDILELSSSLCKSYKISTPQKNSITQTDMHKALFESVSQLNPVLATRLFRRVQLDIPDGSTFEVPIYGDRIFGAPVSFASKALMESKMRAEAYVAQFNYLKSHINRSPYLYLLADTTDGERKKSEVMSSLNELYEIANACNVTVRDKPDINSLAGQILADEAA